MTTSRSAAIAARAIAIAAVTLAGWGPSAAAQAGQEPQRDYRERAGFDFRPDGAWRVGVRRIRAHRARLMAAGMWTEVNAAREARAPIPGITQAAVNGALRVPFVLMRFRDTDPGTLQPSTAYSALLLGQSPPSGRPYTLRTYFAEMSNGLLQVEGDVVGWVALDSNAAYYTGPCNGLCDSAHLGDGLLQALGVADQTLDFGQHDNDGPDGVPNSGDDDGIVDFVAFVHPQRDGACGSNPNIWSHRWVLRGWTGSMFTTNDPSARGGFVRVDDYTIQSGVGGATACDATALMPIGTIAHETGHAFGLPDLYDTQGSSAGIGNWGLMGSGNYATPFSPARMESWSLVELGWVTVVPVDSTATLTLPPVQSGDTVALARASPASPRGEWLLVENRQALEADTAMARLMGRGLLIWHIDSAAIAQKSATNSVNAGSIHGVALAQADGRSDLDFSANRGDAGDPFPGSFGVTRFAYGTNVEASRNSDGTDLGVSLDSITVVSPNGPVRFRLAVRGSTTVAVRAHFAPDSVAAVAGLPLPQSLDLHLDLNSAEGRRLGSYSAVVRWDSVRVRLDSVTLAAGDFGSLVFNILNAGQVNLTGANASGVTGDVRLARLWLRILGAATDTFATTVTSTFAELTAATTFENLLPYLSVGSARIRSGVLRGDVNGDGVVGAVDAQAVLSHVVGISLPPGWAAAPSGDADCSGEVQALDAQIILSYVVGIPVSQFCVGTRR